MTIYVKYWILSLIFLGSLLLLTGEGIVVDVHASSHEIIPRFSFNNVPGAANPDTFVNATDVDTLSLTVDFGQPVKNFDASDIEVQFNSAARGFQFTSAQNLSPQPPSLTATSYTFDVSGFLDGATVRVFIDQDSVQTLDSKSNPYSAVIRMTIDQSAPTLVSAYAENRATVVLGMSELIYADNPSPADFHITGAKLNPQITALDISGTTITLKLSARIFDTETPLIHYTAGSNRISDIVGHPLESFSNKTILFYDVDTIVPTLTFNNNGVQNPTNLADIPFTVTFNEFVTGFDASGIDTKFGTVKNLHSGDRDVSPVQIIKTDVWLSNYFGNGITGVAVNDATGSIYVTHEVHHRVYEFDEQGRFLGVFDDGSSRFIGSAAIDTDRNVLYVIDVSSGKVIVFDSNRQRIDSIYKTGDGALSAPRSVVMDSINDKIYVADGGNNRVAMFKWNGEYIKSFGKSGADDDDDGQFTNIGDIAIDSDDNIYVTHNGNRISIFDSNGEFIRKLVVSQVDDANSNINGIAVDSDDNIYIVSFDIPVRILDTNGMPIKSLHKSGSDVGKFGLTWDIAVGSNGRIYVSEFVNDRIQVFEQSDLSYHFDVSDIGDQGFGKISIRVNAAYDNDGNGNVRSDELIFDVDRVAPTVLSATITNNTSVTLEISEMLPSGIRMASAGFTIAGVSISATTVTAVEISGSTITLTLSDVISDADTPSLTYVADPNNPIADAAGNQLASFSNQDVSNTLDTTMPTVSVATDAANPTNSDPIPFTAQFSKDVIGFTADDITKSSGTVQNFDSFITASHLISFGGYGRYTGQLDYPSDVAVNSTGHVYIADTRNDRISIFDSDGQYAGKFGESGDGDGQFGGPVGIAIDSDDNIYISDVFNNNVQVFDSDNTHLNTFGSAGSNSSEFDNPRHIAVNSTGYIYVVDTQNHRVQIFDNDGTYQAQIGSGAPGYANGEFYSPVGIAIDSDDNVYVSDTINHRVQIFDNDGTYQGQIGSGVAGIGDGQFNNPLGIAIDSDNNIYVVDNASHSLVANSHHRVQIFDNDGTYQGQFGGGIDGTTNAGFNSPIGIALDSDGNIYVDDVLNHRIQKFSAPSQTIYTFDVSGSADQDTLTVSIPADISQDGNGNANSASNVLSLDIDRVAPTVLSATITNNTSVTLEISETLPSGTRMASAGFTIADVSIPATTVTAVEISGSTITLTLSDAVSDADTPSLTYVADPNNPIADAARNLLASFSNRDIIGINDSTPPTVSVATDVRNPTNANPIPFTAQFSKDVTGFTTDDITKSSGTVQNFDSFITASHLISFGGYGRYTGQLDYPSDVAVNSTGHVYVADTRNTRISIFDSDGQYAGKFGEYGDGDGQFGGPVGIAIDSDDNVYISDVFNNNVQIFDSDNTHLNTFGSVGSNSSEFNNPRHVAVNSTGYIYVVDTLNHRVQIFDNGGTYQAQIGSGAPGYANGEFYSPVGIAINSDDYVYVSDTINHRVQIFDNDGTYQGQIGSGAAGIGDGQFNNPLGIAIDSDDNIYVVDNAGHSLVANSHPRVQIFDNDGTYQGQFGNNVAGTTNAGFNNPIGIALDSDGNIYVDDVLNHRIQKFSAPSQTIYTFDVSGSADQDTLTVSIPADISQDGNGNANSASNVLSLDIDRVAPTVLSATITNNTSVTLEISETLPSGTRMASSGFIIAGVSIPATTVTAVEISGSTITLTLSDAVSDADTPSLTYVADPNNPIADAARNLLASFENQDITNTVDTTMPAVTISTNVPSHTNSTTVPFTLEFSEQVTGFAIDDIKITAGTLQNLSPAPSPSATSYTFDVTGLVNEDRLVVSIAAGAVTDAANNPNDAFSTEPIMIDTVAPTVI